MKLPALVLVSLTMWAGISHASDTAFDAFKQRLVGNATTVTFGRDGTPITASAAPLGTAQIRNAGWTNTAEGIFLESNGSARLPGGQGTVPVTSRIKASTPVIGRALYRGALAATGIGAIWQAGNELYDIWGDLGLEAGPTGVGVPTAPDYVAQGGWYSVNGFGAYSSDQACKLAFQATNFGSNSPSRYEPALGPGQPCNVYARFPNGNETFWSQYFYACYNCGPGVGGAPPGTCSAGSPIYGGVCNGPATIDPLTEQEFLDEIATQSGWPSRTAQALATAANIPGVGTDIANDLEQLPQTETSVRFRTGTNSIQVGEPIVEEEVTTNPDGSTSTRTTTRTTTATTVGNQIRQSEESTTTVTTRDSTGTVTGVTTSTTTATTPGQPGTEPSPLEDLIVCGLPDTPPCKIDETGTAEPLPDDGQTVAETILQTLQDCADDLSACLPAMPDISWTFSLPTGCAPIPLGGGFEQYVDPIDICQWQPLFHDLMSMIWAGVGLFGAVALFRPRG